MSNRSIAIITASTLLSLSPALPDLAVASGTYTGRPSRPPASMDRAQYELGKSIFNGNFDASASADPITQTRELEKLRARLSSKAQTRAKFLDLSGRLSSEQVDALRYFLKKRYKIQ